MTALPARLRLTLMLVATLVLVAALAIVLLTKASKGSSSGSGFDGSQPPAGLPTADFALRDQDGHLTTLKQFRGSPVILTFMYSTCRDTCPLTADQIRAALDDVGRDVPTLAISVDPANDTPLNAKRFLRERTMTGRMRFLLGDRAQLAPIWKSYFIQPQAKGFEHSAYVLLLDRSGRRRVSWPVDKLTPEGLAHDLRLLGA
jgi:protein SCO1/2